MGTDNVDMSKSAVHDEALWVPLNTISENGVFVRPSSNLEEGELQRAALLALNSKNFRMFITSLHST